MLKYCRCVVTQGWDLIMRDTSEKIRSVYTMMENKWTCTCCLPVAWLPVHPPTSTYTHPHSKCTQNRWAASLCLVYNTGVVLWRGTAAIKMYRTSITTNLRPDTHTHTHVKPVFFSLLKIQIKEFALTGFTVCTHTEKQGKMEENVTLTVDGSLFT